MTRCIFNQQLTTNRKTHTGRDGQWQRRSSRSGQPTVFAAAPTAPTAAATLPRRGEGVAGSSGGGRGWGDGSMQPDRELPPE